jgi:hypothetical protein
MSKILEIEDLFEKKDRIVVKITVLLKRKKSCRQFFEKPNKIRKPKQKRGTTERFNRGVRVGG